MRKPSLHGAIVVAVAFLSIHDLNVSAQQNHYSNHEGDLVEKYVETNVTTTNNIYTTEDTMVNEVVDLSSFSDYVKDLEERFDTEWPYPYLTGDADACHTATTCENCTALSKWYGECHWCSFDQACHAVGSIHGCTFGSSCGNPAPAPTPSDGNKTVDTCYGQKNCRDCALLSHTCHWCAHDNACHVIGSISGCVTGVDCYDNERCQRKHPEPLPTEQISKMHLPTGPALLPLIGVLFIAGLVVCCATICCCVASGLKGAYDELADLTVNREGDNNFVDSSDIATPLLSPGTNLNNTLPVAVLAEKRETESTTQPLVVAEEGGQSSEPTESDPLITEPASTTQQQPLTTVTSTTMTTTTTISTTRRVPFFNTNTTNNRRRRNAPRSMQRLYSACVCVYVLVMVIVVTMSYAVVKYYPQAPVYNICNDNVAWKSLIDSLTSMKVTADFEILASVSNPNYMDVALDMGRGSFTHNGAFVGTYDIPPTVVAAESITDVLIVAHFMPDKWDALSLTAEYYRGKLVLSIDASVTIRVPSLFNYTFQVETKDLLVNVNEKSDRDLCACPTWNDPNPPKRGVNMELPDFMKV